MEEVGGLVAGEVGGDGRELEHGHDEGSLEGRAACGGKE